MHWQPDSLEVLYEFHGHLKKNLNYVDSPLSASTFIGSHFPLDQQFGSGQTILKSNT